MKLTDQQERAAHAVNSVTVTAGAGTGKTAMLAERFFHHVDAHGLRPIEIVAVTFTEKAAAELRQRIRKNLSEHLTDEDLIAEVDAAQISTIHALAARICREFYYLVEISPDFRILLETESAIWLADKLDMAMAKIDEGIINELGYEWLKGAIGQLLLDPHSAMKALGKDVGSWQIAISAERNRSLEWLRNCEAWADAVTACKSFAGATRDKLEVARCDAINAMADIEQGENISSALITLRKLPAHLGQKGSWAAGEIDQMRTALKALKRAADKEGTAWAADLTFGPEDVATAKKVKLLEKAFVIVHQFLLEQKKKDKVLDFIDLELFAREILEHEQARNYYAKRWRAYLVDEFQDTNPLQAEIIELLRGNAKLTVVGDEKQSIYGFRRADIAVFRSVRESIVRAGGESIELNETFRSHQSLAVSVNATFGPILGELHQPLKAQRLDAPNREIPLSLAMVEGDSKTPPDKVRIVESKYIAREIERMFDEGTTVFDKNTAQQRKIEYRDIAILSRTWAAIEVYIDALSAAGIPAVNAGGGSLLDTRVAKDAIAMLSFLADQTDDISLMAILRGPFFAVSDKTLFELARSKQKDEGWWHHIQDKDALSRPIRILRELLAIKNELSPEGLVYQADALTGYTAVIANLPQGDRREADWLGVLSLLRQLAENGRGDLLGTARQLKALSQGKSNIPRPPLDTGNAVTLASVHNAKGLEWPIVFVPDLGTQTGGFGTKLLVESDIGVAFEVEDETSVKAKPAIHELIKNRIRTREREEDKRLLYVAVTRARDRAVLTSGPEKKGTAIELLMPGVIAAKIPIASVPYSDELAVPSSPLEPADFEVPMFQNIEPVTTGLRTIPVSGLTDYAVCPKKFRYIYVDGHPGLGEGEAHNRTIGTLTHIALQFNILDFDGLTRIAGGVPADYVNEALELSRSFRSNPVFEKFQDQTLEKERSFSFEYRGLQLRGTADLVGEDFVLDYKTGDGSNAEPYRFQLWAYAKALSKPTAVIAFLRQPSIHEYSANEMSGIERIAHRLIDGILNGDFRAVPSPSKCSECVYSTICADSAANASQVLQLSLFK